MESPRVIFIDWHRTLSHLLFFEELKDVAHPLNQISGQLQYTMFVENETLMNDWMLGRVDYKQAMARIAERVGVAPEALAEALAISSQRAQLVSDEIPELLRKIGAKGIRRVIATVNMDVFDLYTVPALRLHEIFDDVLNSCRLGCFKNEEKEGRLLFFDDYLKKHGLRYDQAWLLDDADYKGATWERLGFKTIKVTSVESLLEPLRKLAE